MRICFVCGPIYPEISATSLCALRIAKELARDNEVYILGSGTDLRFTEKLTDNVKLINVFDIETIERHKYKKNKDFLSKILFKLTRLKWIAKFVLQKNSIRGWLVSEYLKKLNEMEKIDCLISICHPFDSSLASYQYKEKHPSTKHFIYKFDAFVESKTTHYFLLNKILKLQSNLDIEKKVINNADYLFYVKQNKNYLKQYYGDIFDKKMIEVDHPLVENFNYSSTRLKISKDIRLIYGGSLKKNYVDPRYTIKVLKYLDTHTDYNVHFDIFTSPSAIYNFKRYNGSRIMFTPWVKRDVLLKELFNSDILVSIATKDGHQFSSKIFEYMSMSKPILHVYSSSSDGNIEYLQHYPLALCIQDKNTIEYNSKLVFEWLNKINDITIENDFMNKTFYYCKAEYISNIIRSKMLSEV